MENNSTQTQEEQRSEEWFEARRGRFTASEIHRLLGKESLKRTKDAIDNFAFEKAIEVVHGVFREEIYSADIKRGVEQEPMAFKLISDKKALDFIPVENCNFYPFKESGGASPDGIIGEDTILEIKCPKRAKFFRSQIMKVEDIETKYYAQMQMQMMATGRGKAIFVNYYIENGVEHHSEILVPFDNEMASLIEERLDMAQAIRDVYVAKLTNPVNK